MSIIHVIEFDQRAMAGAVFGLTSLLKRRSLRAPRDHQMRGEIAAGLTGAGYGEKSAKRAGAAQRPSRAGQESRAGTVKLRIPKLRRGSYFQGSWGRDGWRRR
jgi:hypothetical protein